MTIAPADKPRTILIVEPDPKVARFIQVNLERAGYQTAVCADEDTALVQMDLHCPEMLIVAFSPPLVDGIELTRKLNLRPETRDIPVILVGSEQNEPDSLHLLYLFYEGIISHYFRIPFNPLELLALVRRVFKSIDSMNPRTGTEKQ